MTRLDRPQVHIHATKQLGYSPYDVKWLPCSAKFVVLGQHSRGTGALEIYELSEGTVKLVHQVNTTKKLALIQVYRQKNSQPLNVLPSLHHSYTHII